MAKQSSYDIAQMTKVIDRADALFKRFGVRQDRMTTLMDLHYAWEQCPLDLAGLASADDYDFAHDMLGIRQHMDRRACVLTDGFTPRYALSNSTGG